MKKIMISEELFMMMVKYHLFGLEEYQDMIKTQLLEKLDAMERREVYSQYKTNPDPEKQEAARKKYLDMVMMPNDFRR